MPSDHPVSNTLSPADAEAALRGHFRRRHLLGEAAGILSWDRQTHMPTGAAAARASVMAELSRITHEMLTDPRLDDWLARAGDAAAPEAAANHREIAHMRRRAAALPGDLVAARSEAGAACEMAWRTARAESDFSALRPSLETVLKLEREAAAALAGALELSAYDALLDGYEPGGRIDAISAFFDDLAAFLPPLREKALARPAPTALPSGSFDPALQKALAETLMKAVGFDFDRGRLDTSLHPFCGGADDDVRITTRYDAADFTTALLGVLHESGHAMYEQGLPAAWRDQPVGRARGMTLHESQSLLIEMQVCRSRAFSAFAAPHYARAFGADPADPAWAADVFYAQATRVETGFIRVDADELSYPLHVILRTRLERDMIEGRLEVSELPEAWDAGFDALFGVRPPDAARGCLQDIHWPAGAFGYFPTYTLGAMAAAQIFAAARAALPGVDDAIAQGDFGALMAWLRERIHDRASFASTDGILEEATGAPLGAGAFKAHLQTRYGAKG